MLTLIRVAGSSTSRQSVLAVRPRISRQLGATRYVSDTGLGGFGALSVPIPLKGKNEIKYGHSKTKNGTRAAPVINARPRGRIGGGAILRIKQREQKARLAAEAMSRNQEAQEAQDIKRTGAEKSHAKNLKDPKKAQDGSKSRTRGRRGGKARPPHHTYGIKKDNRGGNTASSGNSLPSRDAEQQILDSAFAPEEIEGGYPHWYVSKSLI
jgi:hypothetical protein